jgi:hypothetical protein
LTVEQLNAIELLVQGRTDQETADAVGVHRVTVTKWRNYDVHFEAELNRRRRQIWNSSTERLRALLPLAIEALEKELVEGNGRSHTALSLIKMSGLLQAGKERTTLDSCYIGAESPEMIVDGAARARRPNPLADLIGDESVTEAERHAVIADLESKLAAPP